MDAIADALGDEPMSVREVAKAAGLVDGEPIKKSSAQNDLVDLEIAGRAARRDGGWVSVQLSKSLKGDGQLDTPGQLFQSNGRPPVCKECGSLLANINGRWVCLDGDCEQAG